MIQDASGTIRQDVTRLWEDTKKWIDEVQKRLKLDREQVDDPWSFQIFMCGQVSHKQEKSELFGQLSSRCGVPLEQLQAWYEGQTMDVKITTTLRQWVKRILDQQLDQQKQQRNQVFHAHHKPANFSNAARFIHPLSKQT
jgi:hypothetical protein